MSTAPSNRKCASLDIGYGFTKLTHSTALPDGKREMMSFPSITAPGAGEQINLSSAGLAALDTVKVKVGAVAHLVGPDVVHCLPSSAMRVSSARFFQSERYEALFLGALAYITRDETGDVTLDNFVVGLPLTVFGDEAVRTHCEKLMGGSHQVPFPGQADQTRTVTIANVIVVPQTLGALFAVAADIPSFEVADGTSANNLVIDVGYGTLMWMLSADTNPNMARSGANMGGVHSILSAAVQVVHPPLAQRPVFLEHLDGRLRAHLGAADKADLKVLEQIKAEELSEIFKAPVDPAVFAGAVRSRVRNALDQLIEQVGDLTEIGNIWLVGGGSHFYSSEVRAAFPKHTIRMSTSDSRYANLRGFQLIAEQGE